MRRGPGHCTCTYACLKFVWLSGVLCETLANSFASCQIIICLGDPMRKDQAPHILKRTPGNVLAIEGHRDAGETNSHRNESV